MKIIVVSQTTSMRHMGEDETKIVIKEKLFWNNIDQHVEVFVQPPYWVSSIFIAFPGECIPRPLASAFRGSKPNEVLYIDYIYMGEEEETC